METYHLSKDDQGKIPVDELAKLIFKMLKRNYSSPRPDIGYYPGSLPSIKREICWDSTLQREKYNPDFEKKYAEAIQTLYHERLIMEDHEQHSPDFVELTSDGERMQPEEFFLFGSEEDEILMKIKKSIPSLDPIVEIYLSEALKTFRKNLLISSSLALGIMSERCVFLLSEKLNNYLKDPHLEKKYSNLRYIKDYWKFIKDHIKPLKDKHTDKKQLWYELDIKLEFLFQCYRLSRNEVGHPDFVPNIFPADQNLRLKTVHSYLKTIYDIVDLM
ncbi:MAG: hypothetical protein LUQ65_01630 [Candidatus Helarchaeota archaeon]|nr:hypothetical protein [Candidatus Helarchaeota archaeon]